MDDAIPEPTGRLCVPFRGVRAGSAALTWGQQEMWILYEQTRPRHFFFNLGRVVTVPPGRDLDDVCAALRLLVERHEALRTTVRRTADGAPRQEVVAAGTYQVEVFDTDTAQVDQLTDQVRAAYVGHGFEDAEWPLRLAVVTGAGRPAYVVAMASHLAVDRSGMQLAADDLGRLLAGALEPAEPAGWHPLDQARRESSPYGRALAERAAGYWRESLMAAPQTMFPVAPQPRERLWPTGDLQSAALAGAVSVLSARHRSSAPGVVLAAATTLLGVYTGNDTVVLRLIAGNRFSRDIRAMVGTCTQAALCAVDLDSASFATNLARTWTSMMRAYRHAQYPVPLVHDIVTEVNHVRGIHLDLGCYFQNLTDGDQVAAWPGGAAPEDLVAAAAATRFRRGAVWPRYRQFSLELRTCAAGLQVSLVADPAVLTGAGVELFLRGLETVLVRAASDDFGLDEVATMTGLAPRTDPVAVRAGNSWIDPAEVHRLLTDVPEVVNARVTVDESDPAGPRFIADVATDHGDLTPATLHRACLARLPGRRTACTPHHYRIRGPSSGGADPWWQARVRAEGSGRAP